MKKILHISDTHGFHEQMPLERFWGVDIIIHSGDCSNYKDRYRNESEVRNFIDWYSKVPVEHKIFVAGNHDTSIEAGLIKKSQFIENGIIYLENDDIHIDGFNFWGSPHTPRFGDWAFMKQRHKLNAVWESIPDHVDVLIVHGPPKGILDLGKDRKHNLEMCGCSALRKRVDKMERLGLVCFGHIHNSEGISNAGIKRNGGNRTIFSNAACVTDGRFDQGLTSFGNIIYL